MITVTKPTDQQVKDNAAKMKAASAKNQRSDQKEVKKWTS